MADQGQKTEQPTERRIEKARREGNFPISKDFVSSLQFAAFVALLGSFSTEWLLETREMGRFLLIRGFQAEITPGEVAHLFRDAIFPASVPFLLAGFGLMAITVGIQLATTRMGLSMKKLQPDFQRLDPLKKLKNLPRQNLPQFFQALILLPLFLFVVYLVVEDQIDSFLSLPLLGAAAGLHRVGTSIEELLWRAAGLFLVLGLVDLARTRRRYRKDLRMSKQEIRDELKEVEGNPQTKGRIRRLQRELVRRQMMNDVAKAAAVIVNPTHYAVAIQYELNIMAAPKVVAKGKNHLALKIRKKAMECEVPIVENPPLAQALYKSVEVGQDIPVHLYRAVAEILAYIYRLVHGPVASSASRGRKGL